MSFIVQRTSCTGQGFIEPRLPISDALPLYMVLVPKGSIQLGATEVDTYDLQYLIEDASEHEVTIPPFFMGRYPITQAQWQAVAALPAVNQSLDPAPSQFQGDNHPVEQVSWYDATEFCDRLAAYTGRPYRLPSETEWEYACRAGTTTPFHFGSTLTDEVANYNASENYNNGPVGKSRQYTTPVDHFGIANRFGLSDMHGNVFEWCADHWHETYEGAPDDGNAWTKGGDSSRRIQRGGGWGLGPNYCRSNLRSHDASTSRDINFGFRVSCSLPNARLPVAGTPQTSVRIFVSYASADDGFKRILDDSLELAFQAGAIIATVSDQRVIPGTNWDDSIADSLSQADIIILLVSPDFLASTFCIEEADRAMVRHHQGLARVVPVILRDASWQETSFRMLQALPANARSVADVEVEPALDAVARDIRSIAREIKAARESAGKS